MVRISWEDRTLSGGLDDRQIFGSFLETEIPRYDSPDVPVKTDNPGSEVPFEERHV
jgi:hypothetical protein